METRRIDDAISLLSRAESWISNRARTNDDYRLARELRTAASDAAKELSALHRDPGPKVVYVGDEPDHEPTECFCNADNAPCNWCENHCAECSEHLDDCECN
jgi:hypothetical protein